MHDALHQLGVHHVIHETRKGGDALELAQCAVKERWPTVATFGGDGTIHEVANALAGTGAALAVFPCGTGNDFARSLGIPSRFSAAFEILQDGLSCKLDLGKDRERYFVNLAAVGFSADVVKRAQRLRLGRASFFVAVYQGLRNLQTHDLQIQLDDRSIRVEALSVHISNNRYSGGGMLFAPDADPTDGWLDVSVVRTLSAWEFAKTFPRMYQKRGLEHVALQRYRARHIQIKSQTPLLKIHDGELIGREPLDVQVIPAALNVLLTPS